jgi:hypothetical protein
MHVFAFKLKYNKNDMHTKCDPFPSFEMADGLKGGAKDPEETEKENEGTNG